MEISFSSLLKKLFLIAIGFAAYRIISSTSHITVQVVTAAAACLVPALLVRLDVLHPWCWYGGFFALYTVAYPLLYMMGYANYGYDRQILLYPLLGLYTALLMVPGKSYSYGLARESEGFTVRTGVLNKFLYLLVALVLLGGSLYISRRGFSNKKDIYAATGLLMTAVFRIPLILSILIPMVVVDHHNRARKLPKNWILLGFAGVAAITLFSGERDLIFRFLIIMFLLLYYLGVIKKRHFLPIGALGLAALPLSAVYKYFFLSGQVSAGKTDRGFLYSFLTSDFSSAGQNLEYLVELTDSKGTLGFGRLFQDLVSLFSSGVTSLTKWFNRTYFPNAKSGKGFTLVGEGYVIGDVVGVIVVFVIAGLLMRVFYRMSRRNMYWFSAYLYFIPLMIYSIRGDLSTIYAGIINQILPIEIMIWALVTASRRRAERKEAKEGAGRTAGAPA